MAIMIKPEDRQFFSMSLDLLFIDEYLAPAPGDFVKVYLYGLRLCQFPTGEDFDAGTLGHKLGMTPEQVVNAFSYWNRMGLVEFVSHEPLIVQYCSLLQAMERGKAEAEDYPYADLARHLQNLFTEGRLLKAEELERIYDWVETLGLPEEVVVLLVKYVTGKMGQRVSINYMEKIAMDWAEHGILTEDAVMEFLRVEQLRSSGAKRIISSWNITRPPTNEELAMYATWLELGFDDEALLEASRHMAGASRPSFRYLDGMVKSLAADGIHTAAAVREHYADASGTAVSLKEIMHHLGWQGSINTPSYRQMYGRWQHMGFSDTSITRVADMLCREGRTKPSDLDAVLMRWSKAGITTDEAVSAYIARTAEAEQAMNGIIAGWGETRAADAKERRTYLRLLDAGHDPALIALAGEYAAKAESRLAFMKKLLENWSASGISTVTAARNEHAAYERAAASAAASATGRPANDVPGVHFSSERTFTDQELDNLMRSPDGE